VIAAASAALFTEVPASRVRKCETCVVHFHDVSKKGARRWCSMNLCGNKVKVAAYQSRKRKAKP
jgi:predicted RNA-binding Zn ribbon-like protein